MPVAATAALHRHGSATPNGSARTRFAAVKPLADWSVQDRRGIVGVFTDIDDTLTTKGAITADALQALANLKAAGLTVIPITGRPIGWCEPFMTGKNQAAWPVDAMVAENGAVAFSRIPPTGTLVSNKISTQPSSNKVATLSKLYQQDPVIRQESSRRMQQIAARVMFEVPGVFVTRDSVGRETDLAFDYNEFARLSPELVQRTVSLLQQFGMHTSVSSIHIHGCFGEMNKWQGADWIVRTLFGRALVHEIERWVFVGDSGNDQAMFQHFTHSIGVANIRHFETQLTHLPGYITPSEYGTGFAEVAHAILSVR